MEKSGKERNWGPLSKAYAWRAGSFLEDMDGEAQVFIEADSKRRPVQVEKWIDGEREWFWLREKDQQPQQEPRGESEEQAIPVVEEKCKRPRRRGSRNNLTA